MRTVKSGWSQESRQYVKVKLARDSGGQKESNC